tara:strand:- start:11 stop:205 length:195 start_codon:yes stop_codon:yes gene_type:complete
MTLAVMECPDCKGLVRLQAKESRTHTAYGFPTMKRRRICPECNFRITTIELPILLANDIFAEDE